MDNLVQDSLIKVTDIYSDYEHLFNNKAKEAMSRPKINKFLPNTRYFSIMAVGHNNIYKAAEKLVTIMNDLADRGYIETFMAPFRYLELGISGLGPISYAVYLWPILTPEGAIFVDAQNYDSVTQAGYVSKVTISD